MIDTPEVDFFGFESFEPNKPNAESDNTYTANLYRDVVSLMETELAPIYIEPVGLQSVTLLPSRAGLHRQEHTINLDARRVTAETRTQSVEKQQAQLFKSNIVVSKRLSDAITLFHELCHEIYETINPPPVVKEVEDSQDRMISEGFATFMDIYFMDMLSQRPELLRLSQEDKQALEEAKKYRIEKLKEQRKKFPHRTQGVLLIHEIFKKGKAEARGDSESGLYAIREYIDNLDRELTLSTSRETSQSSEISLPKVA